MKRQFNVLHIVGAVLFGFLLNMVLGVSVGSRVSTEARGLVTIIPSMQATVTALPSATPSPQPTSTRIPKPTSTLAPLPTATPTKVVMKAPTESSTRVKISTVTPTFEGATITPAMPGCFYPDWQDVMEYQLICESATPPASFYNYLSSDRKYVVATLYGSEYAGPMSLTYDELVDFVVKWPISGMTRVYVAPVDLLNFQMEGDIAVRLQEEGYMPQILVTPTP